MGSKGRKNTHATLVASKRTHDHERKKGADASRPIAVCKLEDPKAEPAQPAQAELDTHTVRITKLESQHFVPGEEHVEVWYAIEGPLDQVTSLQCVLVSEAAVHEQRKQHKLKEALRFDLLVQASGSFSLEGVDLSGKLLRLVDSPFRMWLELGTRQGLAHSNLKAVGMQALRVEVEVSCEGMDLAPHAAVRALAQEANDSRHGRLYFDSSLFAASTDEMADDSAYTAYAEHCAVEGPDIPLQARVYLLGKDDQEHLAPHPTVAGLDVLWVVRGPSDEELPRVLQARGVQEPAIAFIRKVAAHRSEDTSPPGCTAHTDLGGQRGAMRYWAQLDGEWGCDDDEGRSAATYMATDPNRAHSGVLFRPGRVAGDVHTVTAYLRRRLDTVEAIDDDTPLEERSEPLCIENWRRVYLRRIYVVSGKNTLTAKRLKKINAEYAKAAIVIAPPPGSTLDDIQVDISAAWSQRYAQTLEELRKSYRFARLAIVDDARGFVAAFRSFSDYAKARDKDDSIPDQTEPDASSYHKYCKFFATEVIERAVREQFELAADGLTVFSYGKSGLYPNEEKLTGFSTGGQQQTIEGATTRTKGMLSIFGGTGMIGNATLNVIHEIGHCLFLAHAPNEGPQGARVEEDAHDEADECIMSYGTKRQALCGLCILKLQGYDTYGKVHRDGSVSA